MLMTQKSTIMKKNAITLLLLVLSLSAFSQKKYQGEKFDDIDLINNKITFIKEMQRDGTSQAGNYTTLTDIVKGQYAKQPFISSVKYNEKKKEITIKSRVDLILPQNSEGIRHTMSMKYTLVLLALADKCVFITTDIQYQHPKESPQYKVQKKAFAAEDFITAQAIGIEDGNRELKENTKKSTLYFINQLDTELESFFK